MEENIGKLDKHSTHYELQKPTVQQHTTIHRHRPAAPDQNKLTLAAVA